MPRDVETILRELGPSLSSEVVEVLLKEGVSREAARKRISRAQGNVNRLRGFSFPNREIFLFLEGQFGSSEFRARLEDGFSRSGSSFGKALRGLRARGGVVPFEEFPIISGLPIEKTKGHPLHAFVETKLLDLRLVNKVVTPDGDFAVLHDSTGPTNRTRAVRTVEDLVLNALSMWLVKTGWSSPKVVKLRGGGVLPQYGQYAWAFTCPTYLAGIVSHKEGEIVPGFVVGDILLDRTVVKDDLIPFFSKWDALIAQNRGTRLQPWFIAESFHEEALWALRSRGTVVGIPTTLFGEDLARDLKSLIGTLEHAAAAVAQKPEKVFELIERLSKIEGAALNLRGVLIEMIVAHLYKLDGYSIDIRQIARDGTGHAAEIDVRAMSRQEVVCCECKGKAPGILVTDAEVSGWIDKSLPRIKDWLKGIPSFPDVVRFEFYSSTGYTQEAEELIRITEAKHKRQPIKFYGSQDILKRLQSNNEGALVNIYREQFQEK